MHNRSHLAECKCLSVCLVCSLARTPGSYRPRFCCPKRSKCKTNTKQVEQTDSMDIASLLPLYYCGESLG